MPRAFCPECGSEVPIDADGTCHVGHTVDLAAASLGPAGELEVDVPGPADLPDDEPEPWVANVDSTQLGGYTPPPDAAAAAPSPPPPAPAEPQPIEPPPPSAPASPPPAATATPDEPAWEPVEETGPAEPAWSPAASTSSPERSWSTAAGPADHADDEPDIFDLDLGSDDDLAVAAAAAAQAAEAPEDTPTPPPGGDTAGYADFDLDDLEAAVVDMGRDDPAPPPAEPAPAATGPADELDALFGTPPAARADEPTHAPEPPAAPTAPAGATAPPEPEPSHRDVVGSYPSPGGAPAAGEPVDLSNFTAKGRTVKGGAESGSEDRGGKKGFFGLRR